MRERPGKSPSTGHVTTCSWARVSYRREVDLTDDSLHLHAVWSSQTCADSLNAHSNPIFIPTLQWGN